MSVSRRGFLGGAIAGAGAGALASGSAKAAAVHRFKGHPNTHGLLHDTTLCVGCRSCEFSCTRVNKNPKPQRPVNDKSIFNKLRRTTDKLFTVVNRYVKARGRKPAVYRKHQCMHCQEPCCASVCFVKAFKKTPEGPVHYDESVCVGCRMCMLSCPYYALAYEYDNPLTPRVMRCTMCYPRIKKGLVPGCAEACPTGAIIFGKRKDLLKLGRARIAKFPDRYLDHIYGEHEFGGTSWLTLAGIPFGKLGLFDNASHKPLTETTKGFLSVVPLVLTLWPGLLLGFYAFRKRKEYLSQKEKEDALAEAQANAEEVTKKKLADAAKLAESRQKRAVDAAVKKAVAEAKVAAETEDAK